MGCDPAVRNPSKQTLHPWLVFPRPRDRDDGIACRGASSAAREASSCGRQRRSTDELSSSPPTADTRVEFGLWYDGDTVGNRRASAAAVEVQFFSFFLCQF